MATIRQSDGARELRAAVANLLRLADADLADARLLLQNGRGRNAAALASQAFGELFQAVAATEHGWPPDEREPGPEAVPEDNPLQGELSTARAFADAIHGPPLWSNGQRAPGPDPGLVAQALDRIAALVEAAGRALEVDLEGSGPAKRVSPIRDEAPQGPAPLPPPPTVAGQNGSGVATRPAVPAADSGRRPAARSQPVQRRAPEVTSTQFWSLMDRWKLGDLEALALIGHSGGLTGKGTRPRFRVKGQEAELFSHLQEIDAALAPLSGDPGAWLRRPIKDPPYRGESPLRHICRHRLDGARDVAHTLFVIGLKLSI